MFCFACVTLSRYRAVCLPFPWDGVITLAMGLLIQAKLKFCMSSSRGPAMTAETSLLVLHLEGQTGRFTVWALNGSQSSGLVNFVPESRLPFVQISSIYRKAATKACNWYTGYSMWSLVRASPRCPWSATSPKMIKYFVDKKNTLNNE